MGELNPTGKRDIERTQTSVVCEYNIDGKKYIVKSIFVGDKDVKTAILNLAERKAVREMGLDYAIT